MMRHTRLEHRFTAIIPDKLLPGILYVSIDYATAAHSCCCGCGEEIVTPFTPTDWRMEFDGETISLSPSVGSWTLPCRSHYFIRRGKVAEAAPWTEEQVDAERRRDRHAKQKHYAENEKAPPPSIPRRPEAPPPASGLVERIRKWFGF